MVELDLFELGPNRNSGSGPVPVEFGPVPVDLTGTRPVL